MAFDVEEAIVYSFEWLKRRESIKYFSIIFIAQLFLLIFSLSIGSIFSVNLATLFFIFLTSLLVEILLGSITQLYALKSLGFEKATFNFSKYLGVLALDILSVLVALFWSFDKRLRIIQLCSLLVSLGILGFVILSIVLPTSYSTSLKETKIQPYVLVEELGSNNVSKITGFATILRTITSDSVTMPVTRKPNRGITLVYFMLGLILLISLITYLAIAFYNSIRLTLGRAIFLSKEIFPVRALEESWALTKGNVLSIIIVNILISIILIVIQLIAAFVFTLAGILFFGKIGGGLIDKNVKTPVEVKVFWDNLGAVVVAPISILTNSFMIVKIYSMLYKESKQ
ncbi:MAG: hypothetical protein N3F05_00160 [Candidatus Diapherotrites archaeon]|nr:hypothetical protein [Candidatus Diapherotrites archaeon]